MENSIVSTWITMETQRQNEGIELIASENYVSKNVREAMGSILTNKYAEGYPNRRYYGGCFNIDCIEDYAIEGACRLFHVAHANVQPHSGSQANAAAYKALMPNGGKVLSMCLNDGAHLSHGAPVSFSSHQYEFVFFPLGADGKLDYNIIEEAALRERPNVILTGYSAYPYCIDFAKFREIANKVGAYLMVDMAHIAGIIAADWYNRQNPCDYADVVTSTTHKTLRGPRGGLILTNSDELIKKINSAVFPYYQGGPLEHVIAAKGICFEEASKYQFEEYIKQVLENTKECRDELAKLGAVVSDTETHLFLLNTLKTYGLTGAEAQRKLEAFDITTNKNMLPNDTLKPNQTSGLRIGFAAVTSRGCILQDAQVIAKLIDGILGGTMDVTIAMKLVKGITCGWLPIEELRF